jgi:2-dehydro-3-deoxygluconokinase
MPGQLRHNNIYQCAMGGAEANVSIGVSRLGRTAGWQSRLGDDEPGHYILNGLRGEGVDTSHVRMVPAGFTGLYLKERTAIGDPRVFYYRKGSAASTMTPEDLDPSYIANARMLHVTGITPALSDSCKETVFAAVRIAREAGVTVCFDPNMRYRLWTADQARPVMTALARSADIMLPGVDEARMMLGASATELPVDMAARLLEMGPAIVALKLGADGAIVAWSAKGGAPGGSLLVPGTRVAPVDTIGAGDAFAAAVIASHLDGRSPEECCRRACVAGAVVTRVIGDWEGMPESAQLDALVKGQQGISR